MLKKLRVWAAFLLTVVLLLTQTVPAYAFEYTLSPEITVHGQQVLLYNVDTDTVVYTKNADQKIDPSALVKIMTAGLVMETVTAEELQTEITISESIMDQVSEECSGGMTSGLRAGDIVTIEGLLTAMMLRSANDAAMILADYVAKEYLDGTIADFIALMNDRADELGCVSTRFVNCHGLRQDNQFSSAEDLLLITQYMLGFDPLPELCSRYAKRVKYRNADGEDSVVYYNTNAMVNEYSPNYYRYAGSVRGATTAAGTMHQVSTAEYSGMHYILIMLNAPTTDADGKEVDYVFLDSANLYRWFLVEYKVQKILQQDDLVSGIEVPVDLCSTKKRVILVPVEDVYLLLPKDTDPASVKKMLHQNEDLVAPVTKGEVYATMDLVYDGTTLATVELKSSEEVKRSTFLYLLRGVDRFFTNPFVVMLLILFAVFVIGYITYAVWLYQQEQRNKRKQQRKGKK